MYNNFCGYPHVKAKILALSSWHLISSSIKKKTSMFSIHCMFCLVIHFTCQKILKMKMQWNQNIMQLTTSNQAEVRFNYPSVLRATKTDDTISMLDNENNLQCDIQCCVSGHGPFEIWAYFIYQRANQMRQGKEWLLILQFTILLYLLN